MQDSEDASASAFNAFVVDTSLKKQKFVHLIWDGERYTWAGNLTGGDGSGLSWEDFHVNRLRQRGRFEIFQQMQNNLADPGVTLTHHDHGILKLQDIFVFQIYLKSFIRGKPQRRSFAENTC